MVALNKEDAFTIVDIISKAQEIVRCRDCKYMFTQGKTTKFYFCNEFEISVDETDYCAWGEKMDADDFCSRGKKKDE